MYMIILQHYLSLDEVAIYVTNFESSNCPNYLVYPLTCYLPIIMSTLRDYLRETIQLATTGALNKPDSETESIRNDEQSTINNFCPSPKLAHQTIDDLMKDEPQSQMPNSDDDSAPPPEPVQSMFGINPNILPLIPALQNNIVSMQLMQIENGISSLNQFIQGAAANAAKKKRGRKAGGHIEEPIKSIIQSKREESYKNDSQYYETKRAKYKEEANPPKLMWSTDGNATMAHTEKEETSTYQAAPRKKLRGPPIYEPLRPEDTPIELSSACKDAMKDGERLMSTCETTIAKLRETVQELIQNLKRIEFSQELQIKREDGASGNSLEMIRADNRKQQMTQRQSVVKIREYMNMLKFHMENDIQRIIRKNPKTELFHEMRIQVNAVPVNLYNSSNGPLQNPIRYKAAVGSYLIPELVALENAQQTRVDLFRMMDGECKNELNLQLLKTFHKKPYLFLSHDTRVIVDTDVFDICPITQELVRVSTFPQENLTGLIGLTRTKLITSHGFYGKISILAWSPVEKCYKIIQRAKISQHREVYIANMKLNLYSPKASKEIFCVYSLEHIFKLTLDERDLQNTKKRAIFRMKQQKCVDYKIIDPKHLLILYSFQLVLVGLDLTQTEEGELEGRQSVIPLAIVKMPMEQDKLFLAPQFDIHTFPMVLIKISDETDPEGLRFELVDCRTKADLSRPLNQLTVTRKIMQGLHGFSFLRQIHMPQIPQIRQQGENPELYRVGKTGQEWLYILSDVEFEHDIKGSQSSLSVLKIHVQ